MYEDKLAILEKLIILRTHIRSVSAHLLLENLPQILLLR